MRLPTKIPDYLMEELEKALDPTSWIDCDCVWSECDLHCVLVYNVAEASMNNQVGKIACFRNGGEVRVFPISITCWQRPWIKWVSNNVFQVKLQHRFSQKVYLGIVSVDIIEWKFSIVSNTNTGSSTLMDDYVDCNDWFPIDLETMVSLLKAVG
jgi:hypothetical protein